MMVLPEGMLPLSANAQQDPDLRTLDGYIRYMRERIEYNDTLKDRRIEELEAQIKRLNEILSQEEI